jgi:purine-cytosine permease-like protein
MSYKKRQSTLDLAREYLGKFGSYCIAILLLLSTFAWFIAQTSAASSTLTHLILIHESPDIDQFVQVSVVLGLMSTLLCMEGIVWLRRLSTICFPILLLSFFMILYDAPHGLAQNTNALSLSGLSLVLATNLGITPDMPTFFRHSHSWLDSIKGLTITQLVSLIFGLLSLYLGSFVNGLFEINDSFLLHEAGSILRSSLIIFVFVSAICANVANVYSASVGWEVIAPKSLVGRKEYLLLGLTLTILFIFFSGIFSPLYLLHTSDAALVNFCLVLTFAFLIVKYSGKPPSPAQQVGYFLAWGLSTAINVFQLAHEPEATSLPLLTSLGVVLGIMGIAVAPEMGRRLRRR